MKQWCYRWLPIIFGCHCRADRSFFWKGKKFPICARCTGELVGILAALLLYPLYHVSWQWALALMIPMLIDGFAQQLTVYESNNIKRLITGILFGVGFVTLLIASWVMTVRLGYRFGSELHGMSV